MNSDLVQQFVTVVPICSLTSPVNKVLSMMKPEAEGRILVVDSDQRPIGVVSVYDLLFGLAMATEAVTPFSLLHQSQLAAVCAGLPQFNLMEQTRQPSSGEERWFEAIRLQSLQDCLDSLIYCGEQWLDAKPEGASPLRSIRCIPASCSVHDFRLRVMAELQAQTSSSAGFDLSRLPGLDVEWVVVNAQGLGVGLLNQPRVWQYLALTSTRETNPLSLPTALATTQVPQPQPGQGEDSNSWRSDDLWNVFVQRVEEEQARIQRLVHELSQCQAQLKEKDDLLAYISHEMKTPLTAIMGLAELLTLFPATHPSERHHHYTRLIYQSSRRLMQLMAHSLELLHVETQQLAVTLHPVAIAPLCEAAYLQAQEEYLLFTDMAQELPARVPISAVDPGTKTDSSNVGILPDEHSTRADLGQRHPLVVTIQPGTDRMMADERCLKRLMANVLAVLLQLVPNDEACDEGCGEDSYRPAPMKLTVETRNGWTAIQIVCSCQVLTIEQQKQIFQQLNLLEGTEFPTFKQMGFRLLLALRLAQQHGGTLTFLTRSLLGRADHQPQQQMEMTVLLPFKLSAGPTDGLTDGLTDGPTDIAGPSQNLDSIAIGMPNQQESQQESRIAVVVDDDPSRVVAVADALLSVGYWAAIARSGQEALSKIEQLRPNVILLNPAMSYLQDMDILTLLRQNEPTRSIPIIAIAPSTTPAQALVGIDGHLNFPFESTLLRQMIVALTQTVTSDAIAPFSPPITLLYCNPLQWDEPDWDNCLDDPSLSRDSSSTGVKNHDSELPQDALNRNSPSSNAIDSIELNAILHPYHCRVIEVDSIEQAELLARVWQPNLIVCGGSAPTMGAVHHQILRRTFITFQQCEELARLPLVTLTPKITELAHQFGLRVFPCLDPLLAVPSHDGAVTSLALIQVIQVAVDAQSA
ncbi:MAG: response regulator [Cyanothece sp. SIO2G6]|nr:response regulator [Cyanothece sp. SIO2G6]